jgi:hypothetical protein
VGGGLEFLRKKSLRLAGKAPSANRPASLKVRRLVFSTFFAFHHPDLLLIDYMQVVVQLSINSQQLLPCSRSKSVKLARNQ